MDRPKTLTFLMPQGKEPEVTLHKKDAKGKDDSFPGPLTLGSTPSNKEGRATCPAFHAEEEAALPCSQ